MKPALGTTFTYLTDVTVWLRPAKTRARARSTDVEEGIDLGEGNIDEESPEGTFIAEVVRSRNPITNTLTAFCTEPSGFLTACDVPRSS